MKKEIRKILFESISFHERPNINDAFWQWFGKSKVVDQNGDPMMVFHGIDPKFGQDLDFESFHRGSEGIWFSPYSNVANMYSGESGTVYPCYLSIQNPKIIDMEGELVYDFYDEVEEAEGDGFDGLIIYHSKDAIDDETQYCVFNPWQAKSVFNSGSWEKNNSNMMQ